MFEVLEKERNKVWANAQVRSKQIRCVLFKIYTEAYGEKNIK